ncbi:MAG: YitT family protein [Treponema sp.]|nr:YitT family protein [Treponema sp.]
MNKSAVCRIVRRFSFVLIGALLMSFNINTFVHAGGLLPGGFTGLTLLIQEIALRYGNIRLPFSLVNYTLNAVPAIICFRYIGKRFTLYSCLMILVSGFLTDWMPSTGIAPMLSGFLQLHDTLLSAVFGGLLNALSISFCLWAGATSGGTDFIAIFISEKFRKDAWNHIFAGNCAILALAAYLFSLEKALYSIIFQFTTTMALSVLYRGYQQRTLLIITCKPEEVYTLIRDITNHGATSFQGLGNYEKTGRTMLYSVVSANEVDELVRAIRNLDGKAFINVLKTEQINGSFYLRPRD